MKIEKWGRFRMKTVRVVAFRTYLLVFWPKMRKKFPKQGYNTPKILNQPQKFKICTNNTYVSPKNPILPIKTQFLRQKRMHFAGWAGELE